jgi:hypothetical protein
VHVRIPTDEFQLRNFRPHFIFTAQPDIQDCCTVQLLTGTHQSHITIAVAAPASNSTIAETDTICIMGVSKMGRGGPKPAGWRHRKSHQ